MSSFDKVVKLACKPKAAPPKAKYLDPIIAATWSDDGAVHDVCKALAPRFREPNTVVVFKALIVLHMMIRNGATENVLSYLSQSDVLRLRNVSAGNWEGYAAPQNLQAYAVYLDSRIIAYKNLKHDAVRVQSESNRDMRNSASIEEEGYRGRKDRATKPTSAPSRSKTIMGRKLRSMTVEKGLLRETKAVHDTIDALVECRFYLDDLEDELTITALRMLVMDLLILFQAGNEGVINVLEHYFEMSHIDAEEALRIYRHFCKQTEFVVEYLGVAKKLQNLLNVSIPNLKHAPVSLAGALQEYLDDPNFEHNRIEYKANKAAAEGRSSKPTTSKGAKTTTSPTSPKVSFSSQDGAAARTSSSPPPKQANGKSKDVMDFFTAIEEEQPTMFNPQTNSPSTAYFQQQQIANPFQQMLTGQPFMQQQGPQIAVQPTGFIMPQATAVPQQPNPFGNMLTAQPTGHRPFSSFIPGGMMQGQPTGFPGAAPQPATNGGLQPFLSPQMTGAANPFRQSMLLPQSTGMQLFGGANPGQVPQLPGSQMGGLTQGMGAMGIAGSTSAGPSFGGNANPQFAASSLSAGAGAAPSDLTAPKPSFFGQGPNGTPARPGSAPITSATSASPALQPVKSHQTGTRNPFGPVQTAAPPVPKPPTLFELQSGQFNQIQQQQQQQQQHQQNPLQSRPQQAQPTGMNGFSFNNSALNPGASDISSVASSFTFSNNKPAAPSSASNPLTSQDTSATNTTTTSAFSNSLFSSGLSSQPTGATNTTMSSSSFNPNANTSGANVPPVPSVTAQMTGFSGIKPFKPSSSFGASLMETLPAIPGSGPTTPGAAGLPGSNTSGAAGGGLSSSATTPSLNFLSSPPVSTTSSSASSTGLPGSSVGAGGPGGNLSFLRNQPTGATGGFGSGNDGLSAFGKSLGVGLRPQMTGGGAANPFRASSVIPSSTGMPNFGAGGAGLGGGLGAGGGAMGAGPGGAAAFGGSAPFGAAGGGSGAQLFGTQQPFGNANQPFGAPGAANMNMNGFGGSSASFGAPQNQGQQQQQQSASLI